MGAKKSQVITAALISCMIGIAPAALRAHEGKTLIKLTPKPNQAFRCETVQEMEMDATMEGIPQKAGPVSTKMVSKTVFTFTEKTGAASGAGEIDADVTYNTITSDKFLNGRPMPPDKLGAELIGKTITFTFDKDGRVSDVRVPQDIELSAEMLKQMMNSFQGNLPSAEMAVGDTTSTPFSIPLPVPTPGLSPLHATGEARYKLLALERDGEDLIARLDLTIEAGLVTTLDLPVATSAAKVGVDFKVTGIGGLRLNLTRGILKTNEQQLTIEGDMKVTPDSAEAPSQTLRLRGTSKMTANAVY